LNWEGGGVSELYWGKVRGGRNQSFICHRSVIEKKGREHWEKKTGLGVKTQSEKENQANRSEFPERKRHSKKRGKRESWKGNPRKLGEKSSIEKIKLIE